MGFDPTEYRKKVARYGLPTMGRVRLGSSPERIVNVDNSFGGVGTIDFVLEGYQLTYNVGGGNMEHNGWLMYSQLNCSGNTGIRDDLGVRIDFVYAAKDNADIFVRDGSVIAWPYMIVAQ